MTTREAYQAALGPVYVVGKGIVTPKGWVSPERRAEIARVMAEQAKAEKAYAESQEARRKGGLHPGDEGEDAPATGDPKGFVVDPANGMFSGR